MDSEGYYIKVDRQEIPVTEEVYKAYCRGERKERYFREGDLHNGVFSYDALDTEEQNGCDLFSYDGEVPVEALAERRMALRELATALRGLDDEERELIIRIYYYEQSLRRIAADKQIPFTTLQYRHKRILKKLKDIFEHTFLMTDE